LLRCYSYLDGSIKVVPVLSRNRTYLYSRNLSIDYRCLLPSSFLKYLPKIELGSFVSPYSALHFSTALIWRPHVDTCVCKDMDILDSEYVIKYGYTCRTCTLSLYAFPLFSHHLVSIWNTLDFQNHLFINCFHKLNLLVR
jgi:hypothetical protein